MLISLNIQCNAVSTLAQILEWGVEQNTYIQEDGGDGVDPEKLSEIHKFIDEVKRIAEITG